MNSTARICVAGADTLIGAALRRALQRSGFHNLVSDISANPEYVFIVAGQSGGIQANQNHPVELCLDNLRVATELIPAAHRLGVKKLLYLASSCIYPKLCPQPMRVESLLTGPLEPTSEPYAMAKLAGMKLCQAYRRQYGANFITVIPADVFGPGAKFSAEDSHVIPSLLVKMHEAKMDGSGHVTLWGTGTPRREFTYVDDLAEACLLVMRKYDEAAPINLGSGEAVSIRAVAEMIRVVVGYAGELRWEMAHPDGTPVKLLDTTTLRALGWQPAMPLTEGLRATYRSFLMVENQKFEAK